jgi:triacylglycerol lipase
MMPLHPDTLRLDTSAHVTHNASALAYLARAAYFADPLQHYPALADVFSRIAEFERNRIRTLVVSNDEHVAVTFRGTDDNADWAETMTYKQIPWLTGKAHAGFVRSVESIWTDLLAALFDAGFGEKKVWLAGHSLGGTLTVLASHRLQHEGFEPHAAFTYGTPRVFNADAAASYSVPLHRFVNNEDPIPDIPWPLPFDSYVHAGERHFLLPSGAVAESRHDPYLARKIDRAFTIGEGIFESGALHDHRLVNYIKKLEKVRRRAYPSDD